MKKLVFIIAAFFAVLQLPAQPSGKFTGALLWEISGNGLPAPSYIIGTHHLASVDFAQNIPGFNEALSSASQVVGEVVMEDMLSKLGHIMTLSMMPADTTYRDLLSEADYAELDRQLTSLFGAGLDQLGMLKPSMLSNVLSMMLYTESSPELGTMLQDPMSGIDGYVQRVASENGKPCIGLESTESQIDLLVSQPPKQQGDEL